MAQLALSLGMYRSRLNHLSLSASVLAMSVAGMAQNVASVSPTNPTKSGLVRVYGDSFGDASTGSISVGGRLAPIARWTDTLIEFYVPEETPAAPTKVLLNQPTGRKAVFALEVRNRPVLTGRFKWRFEAADQYIIARPAVGPDGTIYALGNYGHIYAIAPNGGLKWVWSNGVDGTVDVGADGTIYCAGGGGVQAFSPNGTRLWQYDMATTIMAGPNVGPDGNIYAADNVRWGPASTGAVVLSPSGEELWTGDLFYGRGGSRITEIQFDSNRAYIWSEGDTNSNAIGGLHAIHLGGGLDWIDGNIVGIDFNSYSNGGVVAHGTSTTRRLGTNGNLMWAFNLWDIGGSQPKGEVLAAPDGGAYFFTVNTKLNALNPNGTLRYSTSMGGSVGNLTLSQDGSMLLFHKQDNFGQPYRIEAYNSNGTFRWRSEDLPIEIGMAIGPYNRLKITSDGSAVYFGTAGPMLSSTTATSYVYAMDPR